MEGWGIGCRIDNGAIRCIDFDCVEEIDPELK